MNIRTKRQDEEKKDVKMLVIYIGDDTYRVSESIDGRLCINKTSCGETDLIRIHPRSGNEVEIS
tara:strand:+ start:179 stop:370 length:192 start_codon:yes stop_codon:yes gene_type:complete